MAAKIFVENTLAGPARFLLAHGFEAEAAPGRFRTFDDKRRGVGVELIGMCPYPAVLGLFEDEGEGIVEFLAGAEPDEFVFACVNRRLECVSEFVARL